MHFDDYYTSIETNINPYSNSNPFNQDKHYHSIVKTVNNKKRKIEYYSTSEYGSEIRDAISGKYYRNMKVGSEAENQFFKVKMFEGTHGFTLFYLSPEDFEKHQMRQLSFLNKDKWYSQKQNQFENNFN